MHISVPVDSTMEVINSIQISPFVSKCDIKVLYVGENRNKTSISKEVATEMGRYLPGSPIVGFYNEQIEDFEEHNREIEITKDNVNLIDVTKPYGFVPTDAKVWFQKFLDDGEVEREYLLTEGYIWTGVYPESKIIVERGTNQSMELEKNSVKGNWAKKENSKEKFFIINEALIEKLCILGNDFEPCFEGAQIKTNFSLQEEFAELKQTMFAMIDELKQFLNEGGSKISMENTLELKNEEEVIEDNVQTEFSLENETEIIENDNNETIENNSNEVNENFSENLDKIDEEENNNSEEELEDEKIETKCSLQEEKIIINVSEEANVYSTLEEVNVYSVSEEVNVYSALEEKYNTLENDYNLLKNDYDALSNNFNLISNELEELRNFKLAQDRVEKEKLINSFYMLSDEDKANVVENIDTYSLDEIEAKLAVICVRNKVNFNLETEQNKENHFTFNLNSSMKNESVPEWVKAVKQTESQM